MEKQHFEEEEQEFVLGQIQVDAHGKAGKSAISDSPTTAEEEVAMMRKRLKEIEQETESIRAKFEKENGAQGNEDAAAMLSQAEKEEVDSRSIYVGNVDYSCTPEELQQHFESCGTVNRITILTDAFGNPKGYAYVEFVEAEAVQKAVPMNESELHGRPLKISPKRTNVPGMKQNRGRRFPRGSFMPGAPSYPSYPYGRTPRYRHPMRYSPY